ATYFRRHFRSPGQLRVELLPKRLDAVDTEQFQAIVGQLRVRGARWAQPINFRTPAPATIPAALPPPGGNRRAPTGPSHVALNESAVCRRPRRSPFNSAASPASPSLASIAADDPAQRGPNRPPHPSRSPHLSNRELRAKSATRRPFFVGVCSRTIRLDR